MGGTLLCLTGDVMTGRGVDQILPAPGNPRLWERYVDDARTYVELAKAASGPFSTWVDFAWPWGDALPLMNKADLRVINLETAITTSDDAIPGKAVHYRMHPGNVGCLTAARPDACVLANNHVLDLGIRGLEETLDTLDSAGLATAGAGRNAEEAWRPLELQAGDRRVLLWSVGASCSGVPSTWAAGPDKPGVAYVGDLSSADAKALQERVRRTKQPGDIAVVSIHWGSNWGYAVPRAQVSFAHWLIDAGVDVVHGHSSHHPRPVEVYKDRLVLYGCGDLVNDYEGISGHEKYRSDLRLLYFVHLNGDGRLDRVEMVPFQARKMRLQRATQSDARWLYRELDKQSRRFGSRIDLQDGALVLTPPSRPAAPPAHR
jgi:poly-gamma-glutamate capsule biosynthesis protein CapA/YwtB (metallophosphatase superfamily)